MRKGLTHSLLSAALISLTTGVFAQTITYKTANTFLKDQTITALKPTHSDTAIAPYYVKNIFTSNRVISQPLIGIKFINGKMFLAQDSSATNNDIIFRANADGTSNLEYIKQVNMPPSNSLSAPLGIAEFSDEGVNSDENGFYFISQGNNLLFRALKNSDGSLASISKVELTGITQPLNTVHDIIRIPGTSPQEYYISDRKNNRILKFIPSNPTNLSVFKAGDGTRNDPNPDKHIYNPTGLALDEDNNLYVANFSDGNGANPKILEKIVKIDVAGNITVLTPEFLDVFGIEYHKGKLYVAQYNTHTISVVDVNTSSPTYNTILNVLGSYANTGVGGISLEGGPAKFYRPFSMKINPTDGDLYIVQKNATFLRKLSLNKYTVSPALPAGLSINELTGEISGTPTNLQETTSYTVKLVNSLGSSVAEKTITIEVLASLPVSLTSFEAKKQTNGSVNVTWTTASEKDNSHFTLAKSTDGTNFATLATKNALGNQGGTYNHVDTKIAAGANYYKLQQVDVDGTTTDLGIKVVQGGVTTASWAVYPNPSKGTDLNIQYTGSSANKLVKVYNLAGQQVFAKKVSLNGATKIAFASKLAAGIYTIQIEGLGAQKFIVE